LGFFNTKLAACLRLGQTPSLASASLFGIPFVAVVSRAALPRRRRNAACRTADKSPAGSLRRGGRAMSSPPRTGGGGIAAPPPPCVRAGPRTRRAAHARAGAFARAGGVALPPRRVGVLVRPAAVGRWGTGRRPCNPRLRAAGRSGRGGVALTVFILCAARRRVRPLGALRGSAAPPSGRGGRAPAAFEQ